MPEQVCNLLRHVSITIWHKTRCYKRYGRGCKPRPAQIRTGLQTPSGTKLQTPSGTKLQTPSSTKRNFDDDQKDTLLNPTVIIEVLSSSSANYDRGEKFEHYRTLASLKEYVLIAQSKYHIDHYIRQTNHQWVLSETSDLEDTIELPSIQCTLALSDVYDKIQIDLRHVGLSITTGTS